MRGLVLRAAFILAAISFVGIIACGGDSDSSSDDESGGNGSTAGGPIKVELNEWTVKASPVSTGAGEVTFNVSNKGATVHELVVAKTDLAADKLPQASGAVDEKQVVPLGRTANISGGKSEEKKLTVAAGKYVLFCNIPAHYDQGMHTAFTVN